MPKGIQKKINPLKAFLREQRGFKFYFTFYVMYTLAFLFGVYLICNIFQEYDKTFLWAQDGVYQHFPAFRYVCDTVRAIFRSDISLSSVLPFNLNLGQGSDILTTLNSYDYTDPISWLCAMAFPLSQLSRYTLMIFIKLWLCGAAFSVFCFVTQRKDRIAVLCGALSYVFSGAVLHVFLQHPNYTNWAYFLPLLLAGVELYRRRGKKALLILSVAFNLIINFYTFFINAVLLAVYVITLSICEIIKDKETRSKTLKKELWTDVRTAFLCLIGAAVAAVVLLPTIYAFLQNPRIGELTGYSDSALWYEPGYNESVFCTLFIPCSYVRYTSFVGLFPIIFVAIGALFSKRKKGTHLKVLLIVFGLFLLIPFAGRVLNGMGYATNRWAYAIPFLCGVILVEMMPLLPKLSENVKRFILIAGSTYILYCFVRADIRKGDLKIAAMVAIMWTLLVFWFITRMNEKIYRVSMAVLCLLSVGFAVICSFRPATSSYLEEYKDKADVKSAFNDSAKAVSGLSSAGNFFRVESKEIKTNFDGINKVNSTDIFWSMMPKNTSDYYNSFELCSAFQNCNFKGLDSRTALLELASVKYYTTYKDDSDLVPYGYKLNEELSTKKYNVYENENALPIAYLMTQTVSKEDYDKLSPIEKQEALMQAAVTDEPVGSLSEAKLSFESYPLDYRISEYKDIEVKDKKLSVEEPDGSITLCADIPENCEIYLRMNGVVINDPENAMLAVKRETQDLTYSVSNTTRISNIKYFWPVIRDGVTFNLGVGGSGDNTITLSFSEIGEYEYNDIELIALPMKGYEQSAKSLKSNAIKNAEVDSKHIEGDITAEKDSLLQFSVPYSIGFSAYVDGKKVDTVCTDLMYLSVPVSKGTHHVELRYATPYLKEGMIISAVTVVGLIAFEIIKKLIKKRKR